jgi:hypothetical protein
VRNQARLGSTFLPLLISLLLFKLYRVLSFF